MHQAVNEFVVHAVMARIRQLETESAASSSGRIMTSLSSLAGRLVGGVGRTPGTNTKAVPPIPPAAVPAAEQVTPTTPAKKRGFTFFGTPSSSRPPGTPAPYSTPGPADSSPRPNTTNATPDAAALGDVGRILLFLHLKGHLWPRFVTLVLVEIADSVTTPYTLTTINLHSHNGYNDHWESGV